MAERARGSRASVSLLGRWSGEPGDREDIKAGLGKTRVAIAATWAVKGEKG